MRCNVYFAIGLILLLNLGGCLCDFFGVPCANNAVRDGDDAGGDSGNATGNGVTEQGMAWRVADAQMLPIRGVIDLEAADEPIDLEAPEERIVWVLHDDGTVSRLDANSPLKNPLDGHAIRNGIRVNG